MTQKKEMEEKGSNTDNTVTYKHSLAYAYHMMMKLV